MAEVITSAITSSTRNSSYSRLLSCWAATEVTPVTVNSLGEQAIKQAGRVLLLVVLLTKMVGR
jgi:hypothetical protein